MSSELSTRESTTNEPNSEDGGIGQEKRLIRGNTPTKLDIFEEYLDAYHERFRAFIDFDKEEPPRQVISLVAVGFLFLWMSTWGAPLSTTGTIRWGLASVTVIVSLYCWLQLKDGVCVRPRPGFWRIIHAINLVYLLVTVVLLAVDVKTGRELIHHLVPGLPDGEGTAFHGTIHLHCQFTWQNWKTQLSKMWMFAHVIGWVIKMFIFRDWAFCLAWSLLFEATELSFQWLVPELQECWWDSLILDALVTNLIGMTVGVAILRFFRSTHYDWLGRKSLSKYFMPYLWTEYEWQFFSTPSRLFHTIVLLSFCNQAALNTFLQMYAFDIPAPHVVHKLRLAWICFLGLPAVAEYYHFAVMRKGKRMGQNTWLYMLVIIAETITILKYGQDRFYKFIPDSIVVIPWSLTFVLLLVWCICHYGIVGMHTRLEMSEEKAKEDLLKRKKLWGPTIFAFGKRVQCVSPLYTFVPLLMLTRNYYWGH